MFLKSTHHTSYLSEKLNVLDAAMVPTVLAPQSEPLPPARLPIWVAAEPEPAPPEFEPERVYPSRFLRSSANDYL